MSVQALAHTVRHLKVECLCGLPMSIVQRFVSDMERLSAVEPTRAATVVAELLTPVLPPVVCVLLTACHDCFAVVTHFFTKTCVQLHSIVTGYLFVSSPPLPADFVQQFLSDTPQAPSSDAAVKWPDSGNPVARGARTGLRYAVVVERQSERASNPWQAHCEAGCVVKLYEIGRCVE